MALYDPREFPSETIVSPDFTVAEFLAWCRTKPADERYDYLSNDKCAIAQFLFETGRSAKPGVGGNHGDGALWCGNDGKLHHTCIEVPEAAVRGPHSFGALVARLEAIV